MDSLDAFCSPKLQQKLVQGSVIVASNVIAKAAETNLGKGKGHIGTAKPSKRSGNWGATTIAAMVIGIKKKHWTDIFTEYGKGIARYTKKKAYRGLSRVAKPFLRPALDSQKEAALSKMVEFLELCLKTLLIARQREIKEPPIELT